MNISSQKMESLREDIILMARRAQAELDKAVLALLTGSTEAANEVIEMDRKLNDMEIRIDNECIRLLIQVGPYGLDFRKIFSVIKMNVNMERVGDEAKTVAKWSRKMTSRPTEELAELARKAQEIFQLATESLVTQSTEMAKQVLVLEEEIDLREDNIINSNPDLPVAFITKALERVGDLACNIAENVIFSLAGSEIRHGHNDTIGADD